jgi:copper(I)-binding protein
MHQSMPGDSSMMGMQPMAAVAIAKGASVEFKAGGYHVMLSNLTATLQAGTTIQLTLTFEHAAPVTVAAEVRAN